MNLSTELSRPSAMLAALAASRGSVQETEVVRHASQRDNEVKLIEKIDDISEGAINGCRFFKSNTLATGSG